MAELLYHAADIPLFQNKVYPTVLEAKQAKTGVVSLLPSPLTGIIENTTFDPALMDYDAHYQNEQNHSVVFRHYLIEVLAQLGQLGVGHQKIVEIGCGKGYFLELMLKQGMDVTGFDPTYEGTNPKITKDYFTEKYNDLNADVFILRHTMEHIPDPLAFLHTIAKANSYRGQVFIEVPTLDWIVEKRSFWDVFYEHCNYFTEVSLANLFHRSITGRLFNGQYMYLYASFADLKTQVVPLSINYSYIKHQLDQETHKWHQFLIEHPGLIIWGAGAKGSTFANRLDASGGQIQCIIDVNPYKQNKYIARTAHPIFAPDVLARQTQPVPILVMNENYYEEIAQTVRLFHKNCQLYTL